LIKYDKAEGPNVGMSIRKKRQRAEDILKRAIVSINAG
jgi:hypothetical protein